MIRRPAVSLAMVALALAVALDVFRELRLAQPYRMSDLEVYLAGGHAVSSGAIYSVRAGVSGLPFTYPPFAALLFAPLSLLPVWFVRAIWQVALLVATFALVHLIVRRTQHEGSGEQTLALSLGATALSWLLLPIHSNSFQGQVNVFLVLLVVVDLVVLREHGSRWFGVGVGIAAAIKLTPAVFVLYLIATRRWRAAATAAGTAVGLTFVAAAVLPHQTWQYFTDLIFQTSRIGPVQGVGNQSLNGLLSRITFPDPASSALFAAVALSALVVGLVAAARLARVGDELAAVTVVGLTGLAVSPVSWVHHAVWVIVALLLLGRRAQATGRGLRLAWASLAGLGIAVWASDPASLTSGRDASGWTHAPVSILLSGLPTAWYLVAGLALAACPRTTGAAHASPA